jgi:CXXX repeat modification system protein
VVPKKKHQPRVSTGFENRETECSVLAEGPIMDLGDMGIDVIKRLLEKRNALADSVRSHLRLFLNGEFEIDNLNRMVQQVGAADKDVRDWFSEMAEKYKWPRSEDNTWMYRVDIAEEKVYLTRRGNFG